MITDKQAREAIETAKRKAREAHEARLGGRVDKARRIATAFREARSTHELAQFLQNIDDASLEIERTHIITFAPRASTYDPVGKYNPVGKYGRWRRGGNLVIEFSGGVTT